MFCTSQIGFALWDVKGTDSLAFVVVITCARVIVSGKIDESGRFVVLLSVLVSTKDHTASCQAHENFKVGGHPPDFPIPISVGVPPLHE